jgi:hypothetical protein
VTLPPVARYPSTATPGFYCPAKPVVKTEDDVIYRPNLPTFEDEQPAAKLGSNSSQTAEGGGGKPSGGAILSQRDSELLLSFLTVPYLRLPLVCTFFASEDRVHKLQSSKLRAILDSVIFEPGRHRPGPSCAFTCPSRSPQRYLLSTAFEYGRTGRVTAKNGGFRPVSSSRGPRHGRAPGDGADHAPAAAGDGLRPPRQRAPLLAGERPPVDRGAADRRAQLPWATLPF